MKWIVQTRASVIRTYEVEAADEKEAEEKSCNITCDHEEDENEETISIDLATRDQRGETS